MRQRSLPVEPRVLPLRSAEHGLELAHVERRDSLAGCIARALIRGVASSEATSAIHLGHLSTFGLFCPCAPADPRTGTMP
ncbi:MAG: hypothetical protein ACT6RN_26400 [Agrobacterium sp.]|uniref:hypothetical protein n=1 Tax=Agrobacterium sp. TaxID=361 RepID=UPI004037999C